MSALLDDEATSQESIMLDEHLAGCGVCRSRQVSLGRIHRSVHIRVATPVPDLVGAVMSRTSAPRTGRGQWIRYSLGVVAATNLVLGLSEFLDRSSFDGHQSRHLGSFTIAVSVGLLFAAVRPHRAFGLLPLAGSLGFMLVFGAALDTLQSGQSFLAESTHALDLLGLVLLWLLANRPHTSLFSSKPDRLAAPRITS